MKGASRRSGWHVGKVQRGVNMTRNSVSIHEEKALPVRLATTFAERVRGKLGDQQADDLVTMLAPCRDVHTFGMKYDLDIAFVGEEGRVVAAQRSVPPSRRIRCPHARYVLEKTANAQDEWFSAGDRIRIFVQAEKGEL